MKVLPGPSGLYPLSLPIITLYRRPTDVIGHIQSFAISQHRPNLSVGQIPVSANPGVAHIPVLAISQHRLNPVSQHRPNPTSPISQREPYPSVGQIPASATSQRWPYPSIGNIPPSSASQHRPRPNVGHIPASGAASATFVARYRPTGEPFSAPPGTLEHWLAERYCLYAVDGQAVFRADIHHLPWPLQPAEVEFVVNEIVPASGFRLPDTAPILHYAERVDVATWPLKRLMR